LLRRGKLCISTPHSAIITFAAATAGVLVKRALFARFVLLASFGARRALSHQTTQKRVESQFLSYTNVD
jgi:hypothetical protein